jgi:hypothetical protein
MTFTQHRARVHRVDDVGVFHAAHLFTKMIFSGRGS